MEDLGRLGVQATLIRILSADIDKGPALLAETNRLLEEDPDFVWLAENWPTKRSVVEPRIGAESSSLEELRDEVERLRVFKRSPAQYLRYQIFVTGTIAVALWAFISRRLEELEGSPLGLQVLVVAAALAAGLFFAWGIATRSSREDFYKMIKPDLSKRRWSALFTIAGLLFLIVLFATLGFAGVTELLYLHDIGTTKPKDALDDPLWDSMAYYFWSLLNAIPVLQIPQTLQWSLGFRFTDHVNPVLLLAYKLAVILPAIATARLAWAAGRVSRT